MASTFAAFLLGKQFSMAAKELAIFPAPSSVDKQVQPDNSVKEKRKTKNATASQKLNLATAHCRQKKSYHQDNSADTNTDERTTGGNSTFAIMAGEVRI